MSRRLWTLCTQTGGLGLSGLLNAFLTPGLGEEEQSLALEVVAPFHLQDISDSCILGTDAFVPRNPKLAKETLAKKTPSGRKTTVTRTEKQGLDSEEPKVPIRMTTFVPSGTA